MVGMHELIHPLWVDILHFSIGVALGFWAGAMVARRERHGR